jgi:hypothetical protein
MEFRLDDSASQWTWLQSSALRHMLKLAHNPMPLFSLTRPTLLSPTSMTPAMVERGRDHGTESCCWDRVSRGTRGRQARQRGAFMRLRPGSQCHEAMHYGGGEAINRVKCCIQSPRRFSIHLPPARIPARWILSFSSSFLARSDRADGRAATWCHGSPPSVTIDLSAWCSCYCLTHRANSFSSPTSVQSQDANFACLLLNAVAILLGTNYIRRLQCFLFATMLHVAYYHNSSSNMQVCYPLK